MLGTPAFVAPEQANGRPVDERTDVFGLGAVLGAILTNHPPYVGATQAEVVARAKAGDLPAAHHRLTTAGPTRGWWGWRRRACPPTPPPAPAR